jgi:hypothetical protein
MRFEEANDFWLLTPECGRVQMIQIDFRLSLLVSDGPDEGTWVHVETTGRLKTMTTETLLVPGQPATLAAILSLFNSEVSSIKISKTGGLRIQFGSSHILEVAPHQSYEAWQIECSSRSGDFVLVCPPGGEVVLFRDGQLPTGVANLGLH